MTRSGARISLIVARDRHGGIGRHNTLPWHLPEDLQHFKSTTLGHPIVMGRKTFESIGRPLPGRRNLVISRNPDWTHAGCERAASLQEAHARCIDSPELFVIGGAQLYADAIALADRLFITEVDLDAQADVFFPVPDPSLWQRVSLVPAVSRTGIGYAIGIWARRTPQAGSDKVPTPASA